jgi:hypothetical protein
MREYGIKGKVVPSYYDNLTRGLVFIVLEFLHQAEKGGGAQQ